MPLFNGTLFQIDQKEMMRYAGLSPKVKEFPQDAIDSAIREALALAEPRGIWQILPYDPENGTIGGAHPLTLTGRSILRHLSHAWSVGVLAVTVGEEIEKASDAHFKSGEYLQGLLLDAAATAAAPLRGDGQRRVRRPFRSDCKQNRYRRPPRQVVDCPVLTGGEEIQFRDLLLRIRILPHTRPCRCRLFRSARWNM